MEETLGGAIQRELIMKITDPEYFAKDVGRMDILCGSVMVKKTLRKSTSASSK